MRLYNTLGSQKEEFIPLVAGSVGMYVCGPTVYDYDHLGHARPYLSFDLLNRFLRFQGLKVKYIQNITDVGHLMDDRESGMDKIQKKARQEGKTAQEIADYFAAEHINDLKSLNIILPDVFPKATEHISEIISYVSELIERGFAYVTETGNVYFRVSMKPDYGKLSHRGLAEIVTGTRVEPAKDKRSPADFALWKAAPMGATEMVWDSPWGKGFPGWHIECSVMSQKYLGETFDIHGSSIEHIFPHHENEIAQAEALTDKPLAKYWIHNGMLTVNGQKMGKSFHNSIQIREALKTTSANELRLAFYLSHYRRPFDYTNAALEQGRVLRRKLFLAAVGELPKETDQAVWKEIVEALDDDLDTPRALGVWQDNLKKISKEDYAKLFDIFGLVPKDVSDDPATAQLAQDREAARKGEDFLTADNRKAELLERGFEVVDQDEKTIYLSR